MKKVFGQTVRDIKREVNKTVLKVPRIEQKVLDATSNEPWGPHGSLLAEIAHASRNYHDYQMIMAVIWKRVNDSGKNWRHVYKGLTVLEYLVANGSERVIDEIKEHAYQLSSLSSFQYIDSSGRDQGANVRKKSQSLGVLVNDQERIDEVRQKAAANRDKFRGASSTGGMYKPGSYSNAGGYGDRYDDDHYEGWHGSRDEDRNGNGYGREREYDYRDDDRYGRNGYSNRHDGDHYSTDGEERHGRDGSRDGDNWRQRSIDDHEYGSRKDQDRDHDDNAPDGGGRVDDQSQDVRRYDHKFSEQDIGAPPSYEEAVSKTRSPAHSERDRETSTSAPTASSPPDTNAPSQLSPIHSTSTPANQTIETFDEFDPRSSVTAAPTIPNSAEMDLLGSLSHFPSNPPVIMPAASADVNGAFEPGSHMNSSVGTSYTTTSVSNITNQTFEDPFGDAPFKAIPSNDGAPPQSHSSDTTDHLQSSVHQILGQSQGSIPETNEVSNFEFGDTFTSSTCASSVSSLQAPSNLQSLPQALSTPDPDIDILADILPPTGPSSNIASQPTYSFPGDHPALPTFSDPSQLIQQNFMTLSSQPSESNASALSSLQPQSGTTAPVTSNLSFQPQSAPTEQLGYGLFPPQRGSTAPFYPQLASTTGPNVQVHNGGYFVQNGGSAAPTTSQPAPQNPSGPAASLTSGDIQHHGFTAPLASQLAHQAQNGPAAQPKNDILGSILPQAAPNTQIASQQAFPISTGSLPIVSQPSKGKFETKSTVWADTLNRGLVDLNISGPKTNPLADIGVDFDAINRKAKRMEKPTTTTVTSTVNMGKAMGSGSGMGRAGASALRSPPNPMMGSGMGIRVGVTPGAGVGTYGGINQPMGMGINSGMSPGMGMGMNPGMNSGMGMGMNPGMGMGMNPGVGMGMNTGMGMNMGIGQGMQFQPPVGFPPGSNAPGSYNPTIGSYAPQQSYGGGYQ